jgi:hypothetical protein
MPDIWNRLRALSTGPGGRLVIPADAAEWLPSILALEDPEFFLKYDVLLAGNLGELLERTAAAPKGPLAQSLEKMDGIRAKRASLQIGQYLNNRLVRQQLNDVMTGTPFFASAKMLGIQGAGERPTRLPRKLLAFELRRAIEPMKWIFTEAQFQIDLGELDRSYETCRAEIDRLARYVDNSDREFHESARELATTLRTFSRASRARPEVSAAAFRNMTSAYGVMKVKIAIAVGEANQSRSDGPDPFER